MKSGVIMVRMKYSDEITISPIFDLSCYTMQGIGNSQSSWNNPKIDSQVWSKRKFHTDSAKITCKMRHASTPKIMLLHLRNVDLLRFMLR